MVVTRAQDASFGYLGGQLPPTEQREANPLTPNPSIALAPPPPIATRDEQLAALAQQVQALTAMIHGFQEQQSVATQHQPAPPATPAPLASQQSARERSPRRETSHHRASPRGPRQEPCKRLRSLVRGLDKLSPEPQHREESMRRPHPLRSSPSSSSSIFEPSRRGSAITCQAEERLDEYHRRLEELARKINNQPKEEYDTHPPYT